MSSPLLTCRLRPRAVAWIGLLMALSATPGWSAAGLPGKSWHEKLNWKAEDYFDAPEVIALCRAIEANDLKEIDRLVAAGADVNARGKDNMTPLLWAYPDNKLDRFQKLLELGADPNVIIESDFNSRMVIRPGASVTQLSAATSFPGYFECVFQHGGDPNLRNPKTHTTPLFELICFGKRDGKIARVKRLIELGADLDTNKDDDYTGRETPVMAATSCFGQYYLALVLLEAGADFRIAKTTEQRLIHIVVRHELRLPTMSEGQKADYYRLIKWLEDHGESVAAARRDIERRKVERDRRDKHRE